MTVTCDLTARINDQLTHLLIDRIESHREEIAGILLEISDHRAVHYEIEAALATLRGAGAELARHQPTTVDSVTVFLPSNVLLYSWILYVAVPLNYARIVHLRAASAVKPQVERLHRLLVRDLDLPVVLHDLSQRDFVDEVATQSSVVVFTGAYQNAETIRHRLSPDQLMLFLGSGINPFVIGPDADLERAVEELISIRCLNSGQDCLAPDVVWVHEGIRDDLLRQLRTRLDELTCGDPLDVTRHRYGPLHYDEALGATTAFLFKHRSRITDGGTVLLASGIVEPTVLLWQTKMSKVPTAEFFAPVFNVAVYRHEADLIEMLLGGRYAESAMGVSLFGCSDSAAEQLSGLYTVCTDASLLAVDDGNEPLGGRGPMANYIAHQGTLSARPILISQAVADTLGRQMSDGSAALAVAA